MTKPILYAGDTALREAASYLAGVMQHFGIEFDYVASNQPFPGADGYRGVVISDYPASNFAAGALDDLAARVRRGMGLVMIGGWESFTGAAGEYTNTVLREVLPVSMRPQDDRVNCPQPCLVEKQMEHPLIRDLPFDEVCTGIGGYNQLAAKPGAIEVLSAHQFAITRAGGAYRFVSREKSPLLVVGVHGSGRVAAFASDVAPHWVGGLVDWGDSRISACGPGANPIEVGNWYARLFFQMLEWTAL